MERHSGFTLPETILATAILITGLAGVAWVFSMSVATNVANRHRASAALVASSKLEEFRGIAQSDSRWNAGGGLNPAAPVAGYFDRITVANGTYLRLWEITGGGAARTVSVLVYAEAGNLPNELIRLSTGSAPGF
jgi:type II secretory pathway pseudopilin PulG